MTAEHIQQELINILLLLDDNDLLSLTNTVTQGLLKNKINCQQDAITAILNYTSDPVSLLRRRVITREKLFDYLRTKNISVKFPTTKTELINEISTLWNLPATTPPPPPTTTTTTTNEPSYEVQSPEYPTENALKVETESEPINQLAPQFAQWFYSMLNSDRGVGIEHFFKDARLKLNVISNNEVQTEIIEHNPYSIHLKLLETRTKYNLYFNPNLTVDGVQGRVDPHGLALVTVCGTLHSNEMCVGIFEQMFALTRDPLCENNWKIKNTELNLKNQIVKTMPSIGQSDYKLLSLPES